MASRMMKVDTSGRTGDLYRLLRKNLYEKNWKDAPVMKDAGLASYFFLQAAGSFLLAWNGGVL